jgi:nucleotide-binding universal stress UspA family protein
LAYDGSPKSREALFVSAYLAGRRGLELTVVTVAERTKSELMLAEASNYLRDHNVHADYISKEGDVGKGILEQMEHDGCDLVVMGGYGFSPPLEIILGSAVDEVLRKSPYPVLICR